MGIFGNGITQNSPIIAIDEFTSNGTWYCCSGMNCAQVITVGGGGGGGGGIVNLSLYHMAGGAGGGAGGVVVKSWEAWRLGATEDVVIGAGGVGGAESTTCIQEFGNPGGDGGNTSFGALQVSCGGAGGAGGYSCGIDIVRPGGAGGGSSINGKSFPNAAGASTNVGCLSENGEEFISSPGGGGAGFSINLDLCDPSVPNSTEGAGSTFYGIELGAGGGGGPFDFPGYPAVGYGGGGGGGSANYNPSTCGQAGGDGYQGIAKIIQYCGTAFPVPPEPCAQIFTEPGTWACCTGAIYIEVIAIGAGGHGGVGGPDPTGQRFAGSAGGAGGGGGGYSFCTLLSFGATECVIVGYQSDTCFGSSVVATRGQNGAGGFYSVGFNASMPGGAGGTGNVTMGAAGGGSYYDGGFVIMCAGDGANGTGAGGGGAAGRGCLMNNFSPVSGNIASGGFGASPYGLTGGDGGNATSTAGQPGQPYGAGGAGGSVPGQLGGTGSPGIIKIIQHFYVPI